MSSRRKIAGLVAGGGMLVAVAAGIAGGAGVAAAANSHSGKIGGSVSVWAEWTGAEQAQFEKVLKPFEQSTGITVNYAGQGQRHDGHRARGRGRGRHTARRRLRPRPRHPRHARASSTRSSR